MSDTAEALDAAVRAHWAEKHEGQLVIGWAIVAATTTEVDESTNYDTDAPDWQPAHHTLGLFSIAKHLVLDAGEEP